MKRKIPDNHKYVIFGLLPALENLIQLTGDRVTGEITFKQWFVLLIVRDMPEGSSVTEIARQHGSSRQNVKRILDSLSKGGYVSVTPDAQDRRGYAVALTERGRQVMADISLVGGQFVEEIFAGIPQEDVHAAARVFLQMFENLQKKKEEQG